MGLLTGLLTLPAAPLRGLLWLGGHIQRQVREEHDPATVIRRQLQQAEQALATGTLSADECAALQDDLLERLLQLPPAAAPASLEPLS